MHCNLGRCTGRSGVQRCAKGVEKYRTYQPCELNTGLIDESGSSNQQVHFILE